MDLREGFKEIVDGWMLVHDQDELEGRIDRVFKFAELQGALSADELATMELMVKVYVTRMTGSETIGRSIRVVQGGE